MAFNASDGDNYILGEEIKGKKGALNLYGDKTDPEMFSSYEEAEKALKEGDFGPGWKVYRMRIEEVKPKVNKKYDPALKYNHTGC